MKGLNINELDFKKSTALHWAAYLGWGCEVDLRDLDGEYTPLHLATLSGNSRIVRKLLIRGADKNILDKNGKTAYDLAFQNDYINICELLREDNSITQVCDFKPKMGKVENNKYSLFAFIIIFLLSILSYMIIMFQYVEHERWIIGFVGLNGSVFFFFLISWLKNPGKLYNKGKHSISFLKLLETYDCTSLCAECEILKPPRSRHCEMCNSCIMVFDHHCPWIDNCVGAKNHKYFVLFLFFLFLTIVYHIMFSFFHFFNERIDKFNYFKININTNALFYLKFTIIPLVNVIGILFSIPISILLCVHFQNFMLNKTTNERFGFKNKRKSSSTSTTYSESNPITENSSDLVPLKKSNGSDEKLSNESESKEVKLNMKDYWKNCYTMCFLNSEEKTYINGTI